MLKHISELINFYNAGDEFSLALSYTAEKAGFSAELIEKDYLCTVVLEYLYSDGNCPVIFKGGTLLAKVYADFYRLSEDLDFTIPIICNASRKQRSNKVKPFKEKLNHIEDKLPLFKIGSPLKGSNESRQYNMELNYQSKASPREGKILIEIGLREELVENKVKVYANTLLHDPFSEEFKVKPIELYCLSLKEAYAEKVRAAFCRDKVAIRDFYDLHYAINNQIVDLNDLSFIELVKDKIKHEAHFNNCSSTELRVHLQGKIESELNPTLRQPVINDFNLEAILKSLSFLEKKLNRC